MLHLKRVKMNFVIDEFYKEKIVSFQFFVISSKQSSFPARKTLKIIQTSHDLFPHDIPHDTILQIGSGVSNTLCAVPTCCKNQVRFLRIYRKLPGLRLTEGVFLRF